MPHIFIEKLESRKSTQSFYGLPYLFPQPISFPPLPWASWENTVGYGGYSNSWFNPIPSYNTPWSSLPGTLSPIRYAQGLISGFGGPSIINPLPIAPLPIPPTTVAPLPPVSITLLYGITLPVPVPIYAISIPVAPPTDILF